MRALVEVGRWLQRMDYAFVVPTPETYRRVNARAHAGCDLRGAFGWSRPFARDLLPAHILAALREADVVHDDGEQLRLAIRFATLGGALYVCSAHPTDDHHAVFFGPDTYRFCAALARVVDRADTVVDIGCGTGAGGLSLTCRRLVLADTNPRALAYARVNAELAGREVELVESDLFARVPPCDLAIANPPYIADDGKLYSNGGALGIEVARRIVEQARGRAKRLVMYTGAPIVDGRDLLREALDLRDVRYEELDPDVFGEELERPAYASVERIAVVLVDYTQPS